jgi:hypothetical protein
MAQDYMSEFHRAVVHITEEFKGNPDGVWSVVTSAAQDPTVGNQKGLINALEQADIAIERKSIEGAKTFDYDLSHYRDGESYRGDAQGKFSKELFTTIAYQLATRARAFMPPNCPQASKLNELILSIVTENPALIPGQHSPDDDLNIDVVHHEFDAIANRAEQGFHATPVYITAINPSEDIPISPRQKTILRSAAEQGNEALQQERQKCHEDIDSNYDNHLLEVTMGDVQQGVGAIFEEKVGAVKQALEGIVDVELSHPDPAVPPRASAGRPAPAPEPDHPSSLDER